MRFLPLAMITPLLAACQLFQSDESIVNEYTLVGIYQLDAGATSHAYLSTHKSGDKNQYYAVARYARTLSGLKIELEILDTHTFKCHVYQELVEKDVLVGIWIYDQSTKAFILRSLDERRMDMYAALAGETLTVTWNDETLIFKKRPPTEDYALDITESPTLTQR